MSSTFMWLDANERDRQRTLDVLDLFEQKETVDELGLGSVRDTVADVLTPGSSTIQTRARYFFFIPWLYQSVEEGRGGAGSAAQRALKAEQRLIRELNQAPDAAGAFGKRAGLGLKRLPSTVYWAGLQRLGFRLFHGARDRYHRALDAQAARRRCDAGEDGADAKPHNWHPNIPPPPPGFPEGVTFDLTSKEAAFFLSQLEFHARDSMLTFFVGRRATIGDEIDLPWLHKDRREMPTRLQEWLHDAQCFSELMRGAQLLYNYMLAEKRRHAKWLDDYRTGLAEWLSLLEGHRHRYTAWDRSAFWHRLRAVRPDLPREVERFCETWITFALQATVFSDLERPAARSLIADRERRLKGSRARLQSQSHLELWGGKSGTEQLNYRWSVSRWMINDIVAGLLR